jgi:hypothetical protein
MFRVKNLKHFMCLSLKHFTDQEMKRLAQLYLLAPVSV